MMNKKGFLNPVFFLILFIIFFLIYNWYYAEDTTIIKGDCVEKIGEGTIWKFRGIFPIVNLPGYFNLVLDGVTEPNTSISITDKGMFYLYKREFKKVQCPGGV